jgi:hypothetical protein
MNGEPVWFVIHPGREDKDKESEAPMKTIIAAVLSFMFSMFAAETPDQIRDRGFEALKAAQSDDTKTVEAARLLAQAAEAYEKAGDDNAASELGSYLYWCKKRMTLAQAETFAKSGDSGKRITAKLDVVASQKVAATEAGKWLEKAEAFAVAHPNDPLLCAIRYFEVADRFVGSQESLIAQRKSLDLMGKVVPVSARRQALPHASSFTPIGTWEFKRSGSDKVYRRTFKQDNTFETEGEPLVGYNGGTWEVKRAKLECLNMDQKFFTVDIIDSDTMSTNGIRMRRVR